MISMDRNGGRTVHLFIPFEFNGRKIESIVLAPFRFGHSLRWSAGDWKEAVDLLVELAGVDQAIIRELRYPDADRVMEAFLAAVTPEIRQDITDGRIPVKQQREEPTAQDALVEEERVTNGSGQPVQMQGPGVPLPEPDAGFDLSDEQP